MFLSGFLNNRPLWPNSANRKNFGKISILSAKLRTGCFVLLNICTGFLFCLRISAKPNISQRSRQNISCAENSKHISKQFPTVGKTIDIYDIKVNTYYSFPSICSRRESLLFAKKKRTLPKESLISAVKLQVL